MGGVSRVFVRTSVTPRFVIQDVGQDVVRVVLENTRALRRNDLRLLDTSFFSSAVVRITPARRGSSYVLDIRLKERVPYQQKLEGDVLAIDFERPGAPAAVVMVSLAMGGWEAYLRPVFLVKGLGALAVPLLWLLGRRS